MAITDYSQLRLAVALCGQHAAADVCDKVDAGSGNITDDTKTRLKVICGDLTAGNLKTAINADSAPAAFDLQRLDAGMMDNRAYNEITGELG